MLGAIRASLWETGKSFPLTSHEDSEGGWNVGFPSLLWHSVQLRRQSWQICVPATLYPQGNSLVLTSVRGWALAGLLNLIDRMVIWKSVWRKLYEYSRVVDTVVRYGVDGPGIDPSGSKFSARVQTSPGAHPASGTVGTGSLSRGRSDRGVALTTNPNLLLRLKKE